MLDQSFANADVKRALVNCVPVKVDVDKQEKLADKYGVSSIPHIVVLEPLHTAEHAGDRHEACMGLVDRVLGTLLEQLTRRDLALECGDVRAQTRVVAVAERQGRKIMDASHPNQSLVVGRYRWKDSFIEPFCV